MKNLRLTTSYLVVLLIVGSVSLSYSVEKKESYWRCLKTEGSSCESPGGEITGTCRLVETDLGDPCEVQAYGYEESPGVEKKAVCCSRLLSVADQGGPDYPFYTLGSYNLFCSFDSTYLLGVMEGDTFPVIDYNNLLGWDFNVITFEAINDTTFRFVVYEDDTLAPYYQGSPNFDTITLAEVLDAYGAWLFGGPNPYVLKANEVGQTFRIITYPTLKTDFILSGNKLSYKFLNPNLVTYNPEIIITNLQGKELFKWMVKEPEKTIDLVGTLSQGIYIITIQTSWSQQSTKVFVE